MSAHVCINANTLRYPRGAGLFWVYLNWALGFRSLGFRVTWLELIGKSLSDSIARENLAIVKGHLKEFDLDGNLAAYYSPRDSFALNPPDCLPFDAAAGADLIVNFQYGAPDWVISAFRRSAFVDIDPGLNQMWISRQRFQVTAHSSYFTIGETVGRADALFPDAGLPWQYTPPCVALDQWPVVRGDGPFTTVTHWEAGEWADDPDGGLYRNDKRTGFADFLDLPSLTTAPLELALSLGDDEEERRNLLSRGWRIRNADEVSSTLDGYRDYVRQSRGEFSCAKPSYVRLQTAWISDRTLCYLASGKPVVVQHTGPSRFLPDASGIFRFRTPEEARRQLDSVMRGYDEQCVNARALAEEYFDAHKVAASLYERAI